MPLFLRFAARSPRRSETCVHGRPNKSSSSDTPNSARWATSSARLSLNKIGVIITIFVVAFLALVAYSTLHGPRYRVEACMAYQGRTACKTVSAKSEQAALRSAAENACADI